MKSPQQVNINPANAILVIVDMQNKFCRPGGRWFTETSAAVVPGVITAVSSLVTKARGAHIPIIYIQSVRNNREPAFLAFDDEPQPEDDAWGNEIIDEIKPGEGDIIIQKSSHDSFYQTELDRVLDKLVTDPGHCQALITGGAINVCAYHAVLGFHVRQYWTVVPIDAVYYSRREGKDLAMEMLSWRAYRNVFFSRTDLIEVSEY